MTMAQFPESKDADKSLQTYAATFLVHNLHCSTCVSHATDIVQRITPGASIRVSIIDHIIRVDGLPSQELALVLVDELTNAGFEVEHLSVIDVNRGCEITSYSRNNSSSHGQSQPLTFTVADAEVRRKHQKNCDVCREENKSSCDDMSQWLSRLAPRNWRKTSRVLRHKNDKKGLADVEDGIGRADLQSLPASAIPTDLGEEVQRRRLHEFTVYIGGMTCASCTQAVQEALEQVSGVQTASVNLLAHHAKVIFLGYESTADDILEAIEDIGFEAKRGDLRPIESQLPSTSSSPRGEGIAQERTIDIQISGMYCRECPLRIMTSLQNSFADHIKIIRSPSLNRPYISMVYKVARPSVTIRVLVDSISALDPAYAVSISRPPNMEQRSLEISLRERRRVLRHLLVTFVVAFPSFMIGVVFMSLVPQDNTTRRWLEEPIWAGIATRSEWILFFLTTPAYFYGGSLFHVKALKEVWSIWRPQSKAPFLRRFYRFGSMNLLISAGTSVAYFASVATLGMDAVSSKVDSNYPSEIAEVRKSATYFDTATFLILFILVGKFLEAYSKAKAGDIVSSLSSLRPDTALLMNDEVSKSDNHTDNPKRIPVELLELHDLVGIPHGACPPADGVLRGNLPASFDESSLTGESKPVRKSPGDKIFIGTTNVSDAVMMKVTSVGARSILDQIIDAVREGQSKRAPIERLADKLMSYFTPIITLTAIMTWIIWLSLGSSGVFPQSWLDVRQGGWPFWSLEFAIAVFVVACPCGIGLAAPTALFVGGGLAARQGILVQGGGQAFQEASQIDAIVLDKTGTLTEGRMQVVQAEFLNHRDADRQADFESIAYTVAKTLETRCSHPIARAIVDYCNSHLSDAFQLHIEAIEVKEIPGKGMSGNFHIRTPGSEDKEIEAIIGNDQLLADVMMDRKDIHSNPVLQTALLKLQSAGCSTAILAMREISIEARLEATHYRVAAIFAITDPIRTDALDVLNSLRDRGISIYMCTGDNLVTARAIASQLAIPVSHIRADVLPQDKAQFIRELQQPPDTPNSESTTNKLNHRTIVAFVGDGTNDTPALAAADVSIAISHPTASDIALTSSSFILLHPKLTSILTLVTLSRRVFNRVKFNFFWAGVYNIILIPVTAGAFFFIGADWSADPRVGHGGFRLSPVWAAAAMAGSSISVVVSSLALRWEDNVRGWIISKSTR